MNVKYVELPEVIEALRPLLGEDAESVGFEDDGQYLFVNWPASMTIGEDGWRSVERIVMENLPTELRNRKVSIT